MQLLQTLAYVPQNFLFIECYNEDINIWFYYNMLNFLKILKKDTP